MGRNLFSSLAIKDNLKVAFLEKNSTNPNKYLVTITVWALAQLFCLMLITRSKSGYMTNFSQKMPLSNYQPWPMMNQKISSIFRFYIPRMYDFCQNWRWPLQLLLKRSLSRCEKASRYPFHLTYHKLAQQARCSAVTLIMRGRRIEDQTHSQIAFILIFRVPTVY